MASPPPRRPKWTRCRHAQGAARFLIDEDELLTAALTIHGIEARHAAYLNGLQGESPFPDAVNPTLTPDEVLAAAGPFIVG